VQPEVRGYVPVARKVTLAARASMGFLFPSDYGNVIQNLPQQQLTDQNRAAQVRDIETVYWRGFFSGGPSSNRGYPLRSIAPHGVVPFLNPATASQQIALQCNPNNGSPNVDACSIPIGGFTLWEYSTELRFRIAGPFTSSLFCDMGDVSQKTGNPRFMHLHLSCGTGARYDTPVGPIRFDIGYRIQPLQVIGLRNETAAWLKDKTEGLPPRILGIPMAISVGIGEAY
jgi:outer membrane protein insertion porin family/translocation and assembly module TamA